MQDQETLARHCGAPGIAACRCKPGPGERANPGRRVLMEEYGSIDYARQIAHGLAGAALHEFSVVCADLPDSPDKQFMEALPTWVIERS